MSEEEGFTEQQRQLHAQAAAWLQERNVIELMTQLEEAEEEMGRLGDDDEAAYALSKQMGALGQQAEAGLQEILAIAQSVPESPGERAFRHTQLVSVNKLRRFLPTVGKGMSEANDAASNNRRQMVHAEGATTTSVLDPGMGVSARSGSTQALTRRSSTNSMRSWEDENMARRRIRGTMGYRDRALCWLMMLRQDFCFHTMEDLWGPSAATFQRDFVWMTTQATTLELLNDVREKLSTAADRANRLTN
ncbi:unnamed protein product [Ectocarpus sp. CCAP 1310/34]|nr:unnamed protein product [Ectocarpus sp. CCAP 1310/34]